MTLTLNDYYETANAGILGMQSLYAAIKNSVPVMVDDTEKESWNEALWKVQKTINNLERLISIHRYERVTKEQFVSLFSRFTSGDGSGKIVISFEHLFTTLDTPRGLEHKYGMPYQEILQFNDMTSDELMSSVPGAAIKIPVTVTISTQTSDVPIFGDQSGDNILGRDLPNELVEDTVATDDGIDLKVLEPVEGFVQTIQNVSLSQYGSLPFYESFGLDLRPGEDYPSETIESLTQLKVLTGLLADPRVKAASVMEIIRDRTSLMLRVQIQPIHGKSIILPINQGPPIQPPASEAFSTSQSQATA